jgi:esterase/lipase superfamily enzyme
LSFSLASCGTRSTPQSLVDVDTTGLPKLQTTKVYAVTTRGRVVANENVFDASKSPKANYAEFTVSIPPNHKPSEVEWPGKRADPKKTFAVVNQEILDEKSFIREVNETNGATGRVGVFVHGYNNNFQEAVFRLAQISADSKASGANIAFSWPSQGAVSGYVADKEAATYSRDYLAQLLIELTQTRKTGDVYVFAHSMGGWLTVEALRQLKLSGRDDVLNKLKVILAAPDIDADVFRAQLAVIGRMRQPLTVLVAPDDRALEVSKLISSSRQRVGALDVHDPAVRKAAEDAGVQLVDISSIKSLDSSNHNRFADVAALAPALDNQPRKKGLGQAGAFIFDAAAATVSSPFRLVSGALSQ